jgi:selenocysteine lyase/cysteine desulfurase
VPLDVPSMKIDLFTCGGQKWMLGPCGTGFFYLSERAEKMLSTPLYGWLSVDWGVDFTDLMRYDLPPRKGPAKYETMTYPFQDIRAYDASIDLLMSFDPFDRWEHIKSLTGKIIEAVDSLGFVLASSRDESRRSGILNFKAADSNRLFEFLQNKRFSLSFREGGIRVSPHFYNSFDEIDRLTEALEEFKSYN